MRSICALLIALAAGCDDAPGIPATCNGSEALCARAFDEVAYPTTHNAMSNADEGWVNPNQTHGITRQLEDGVRGLMLDVHLDDDFEPALCHGLCALGSTKLADGLGEIESFLADHRGEVVTIIFESYVTADDIATGFEASGLIDYVRAQQPGAPWPTLRELIDADERLLVFTDADGGAFDWYHDVWAFSWETHYSARTPDDFSCDINRGSLDNDLFIFNHFLTQTVPGPDLAEMVNFNPYFGDRVDECAAASGRTPNFVTVDFYDIGDLFAVVDTVNGVSAERGATFAGPRGHRALNCAPRLAPAEARILHLLASEDCHGRSSPLVDRLAGVRRRVRDVAAAPAHVGAQASRARAAPLLLPAQGNGRGLHHDDEHAHRRDDRRGQLLGVRPGGTGLVPAQVR